MESRRQNFQKMHDIVACRKFREWGWLKRVDLFKQSFAEPLSRKQAILFEIGSAYYSTKDMAKAEEAFERALVLLPNMSMQSSNIFKFW